MKSCNKVVPSEQVTETKYRGIMQVKTKNGSVTYKKKGGCSTERAGTNYLDEQVERRE